MVFLKLENSADSQAQFGVEVELEKEFIEYYYYEKEFKQDSHNRMVVIVKYGKDFFRIATDSNRYFENWYKRK